MTYVNKGPSAPEIIVSLDPDRSGNFVCDGTADDVEIQAAIDSVVVPGAWIHLRKGSYQLTAGITIATRGITFTGAGHGIVNDVGVTQLYQVDNTDAAILFTVTAQNCHLRDFSIHGNKGANAGGGTLLDFGSADGAIENIGTLYGPTVGVNLSSSYSFCKFVFCEYNDDNGFQGGGEMSVFVYVLSFANEGSYGILAKGTNQTWVGCCSLQDARYGFLLDGCDNGAFIGCQVHEAGRHGFWFYGADHNTVSSMNIFNCGTATDNTYDGFHLSSKSSDHSENNLIIGSHVYSDAGNKHRYCINESTTDQDYNYYVHNILQDAQTALAQIQGANTKLPAAQFQFTEPIGTATIVVASPTGIDVDANTEGALVWGQIPIEAQEVQRIKIWAVALDAPIGAGGQMHLELTFNAGASNATYNEAGKSWTLANFDGEEADYVANDVIHWVIEDGDVSNEILALKPGDSFEMLVTHEAGADPDGATDALFRVLEMEYV